MVGSAGGPRAHRRHMYLEGGYVDAGEIPEALWSQPARVVLCVNLPRDLMLPQGVGAGDDGSHQCLSTYS